jgi:hypothetical protein
LRVSVFAAALSIAMGSVALAGCGDATAPQPAAALGEPFFIRGSIAETGKPSGTLVRGEGSPRYPVTAAYFTVGPSTLIQRANGSAASAAELTVGQRITVWSTGVVMESLPVQISARLIVIE